MADVCRLIVVPSRTGIVFIQLSAKLRASTRTVESIRES